MAGKNLILEKMKQNVWRKLIPSMCVRVCMRECMCVCVCVSVCACVFVRACMCESMCECVYKCTLLVLPTPINGHEIRNYDIVDRGWVNCRDIINKYVSTGWH